MHLSTVVHTPDPSFVYTNRNVPWQPLRFYEMKGCSQNCVTLLGKPRTTWSYEYEYECWISFFFFMLPAIDPFVA